MSLASPPQSCPPRPHEPDETYTLLCVQGGGLPILLDLAPAGEGEQVKLRARRLLAEHPSCASVEIWLNERLVTVETRSAGSAEA